MKITYSLKWKNIIRNLRYLLELNDHQIIDNTTLKTLTHKHAQNVYIFIILSNI